MDRRSSDQRVLQELRSRAVEMKQNGYSHAEIASALNIGESTSRKYWSLFKNGGGENLKLGTRGRRVGSQRKLSARQEKAIIKAITDKTPDQLKMPFALWTRQAVGTLVETRYGIKLPVRTLGEYLKRWGFTPQKPKRKDYEQQPEAIRDWLDEIYPNIQQRAREEGAEILWGDETGINNQDQTGRSYAPKGKTPTRAARAKKVSTSMISAVSNRGALRFMIYQGGMTAKLFLRFLKRLIHKAKRKIFLIVDNLPAHKAKFIRSWLDENEKKIEIHYLPPYSPDLNPDEYLNNTLKNQLGNMPPSGTVNEQQKRVRDQMRSNQRRPELIKSLFRAPSVRYAA